MTSHIPSSIKSIPHASSSLLLGRHDVCWSQARNMGTPSTCTSAIDFPNEKPYFHLLYVSLAFSSS